MNSTGSTLGGRIGCAGPIIATLALTALSATAGAQDEGAAGAQDEGAVARRAWSITPSVTLQETYSDNANISSTNAKSDWITEVAPGIRVDSRTARLNLYVDYRLRELLYANNTRGDQTQQTLNSFGKLEAIDNLLFVEANGHIAQQRISAFGSQSAANYSVNANSTETRSFRLSPYLKGRLAGYADYLLRYSDSRVRSDSSLATDVDSRVWSGRLAGDTPLAALGWSVDADRQYNDYRGRRNNHSEHWRGMLTYAVTRRFRLMASGGQERNDYQTAAMTSFSTHGFGFDWRPTERSLVSAFNEKRFFGDGHTLTVSHRMARSAVKFTDSRDVSVLPPQATTVGLGTNYDLFYYLLSSEIPDETQRDAAVTALLNAYGIAPDAVVTTDFISGQSSVKRRQELSYILYGSRNVLTLSLTRSHDERLGTAILVGINDFSTTSTINQRGVNVNWAHKLSALSSLDVTATHMRTTSGSDFNSQTTQKMLSATISTRLGARTHGSVTLRRTEYSSNAAPYSENALSGTVSVEF